MTTPIYAASITEDEDGTLIFEPLPPICSEYGRDVHSHITYTDMCTIGSTANADCSPYVHVIDLTAERK